MCSCSYLKFIFIIFSVVIGNHAENSTESGEDNPNNPEICGSYEQILEDLIPKLELIEIINLKLAKIEEKLKKMEKNDNSQLNQKLSKLIDEKLQSIDYNISKSLNETENNFNNYLDNRLQTFEENLTRIFTEFVKEMNSKLKSEHENLKSSIQKQIDDKFESQKNISMPTPNEVLNHTEEQESKLIEICSHPNNCAEIFKKFKQFSNGIYKLCVPGVSNFDAYCVRDIENKDGLAWTVIQRRQNGLVNFTRNWMEYKKGFGDWYSDFWLGLERIHALTSQQHYELLIGFVDSKGDKYYAKYDKFSISNEEDGYRLKLGNYSGNTVNSFWLHNDMKFTTWDVDNDLSSTCNCAKRYKSGWWFSDCFTCNLNGVYNSTDEWESIIWTYWQDLYYLKFVQMAIRPKNMN